MALKGLGKMSFQWLGGPSRVNFLLHQHMVRMLVVFYGAQGDQWASIQTLLNWECLLRVASEGTTVYAGCPLDARLMTRDVPNALWVENCPRAGKIACFKMRRRKHRPKGSLLVRKCRCYQVGTQFCLPCCLEKSCYDKEPGDLLWCNKATDFAKRTKAALVALKVPEAENFTLKAFRAGKTTQMAREGDNLALILTAGEWKSASFARYADAEKIDEERTLWCALEASDREDEHDGEERSATQWMD